MERGEFGRTGMAASVCLQRRGRSAHYGVSVEKLDEAFRAIDDPTGAFLLVGSRG